MEGDTILCIDMEKYVAISWWLLAIHFLNTPVPFQRKLNR